MKNYFALAALLLAFAAISRADWLPLRDDASLKNWKSKNNTRLAKGERGALLADVRTGAADYGWFQCAISTNACSRQAVGVYGRFRAEKSARSALGLALILHRGRSAEYYACSLGSLADSQGEWIEFYAPFSDLTPERNAARRRLSATDLRPDDTIEIRINGIADDHASAEFDRLSLLDARDEAGKARAIERTALARALLPESRCTGAPHPRLLLNAERLARVRAKATAGGDDQAVYEALIADAESDLKSYPADAPFGKLLHFQAVGDVTPHQRSGQLEGTLNAAAIPIEILAAAYRITGDERFGRCAARALVSAARSVDADNDVLNSGFYYTRTFYVRALAFGYDWLWPLLTPAERTDIKTTLLGFVLQIHKDSMTAGWGRRPLHRVWNWDPGLVSCAGLGMLALEGETSVAEKAILFDLRRHLHDYLTLGIDRDGAGHEGPGYLAYGIGAGPEFAECLREQGRGDLFTETNWQLIPPWLVAETLPDRIRWNNLSDCSHNENPAAVYSYTCGRLAELARKNAAVPGERLPPPEDQTADHDYLWHFAEAPGPRRLSYPALAALMGWEWENGPGRRIARAGAPTLLANLLFFERCPAAENPGSLLPDALLFRGRGLAVSRTGYGSNDVYLAVEAGPHAAGHDQADKGSFTLYGYGADLAIDSGYGNDGEPFKSGSSFAHNMVLIDGQGEPLRWHNQSSGHITGYRHTPAADWIRVDAREAWNVRYDADWTPHPSPSPVDKAVRQFLFVRGDGKIPPYLVVMDDIRKDGQPADYTWLWHIPASMRFRCGADRWTASALRLSGTMLTTAPGHAVGGAHFTFTAPAAGRYRLAGLVRAGGDDIGKSDSFHVRINNGRRIDWGFHSGRHFGWEPIANPESGDTNLLALAAGETVRVEVTAREPEAQLARLALVPADASLNTAPDAAPAGAAALAADDAELMNPPLLRQPIPAETRADARLTVFPVTTDARLVTNGWFVTSCEGLHPRLEHTVRAVEPRFLMVLVPGDASTPIPSVRRIDCDRGVAAEVAWDGVTDQVRFGTGESAAAFLRRIPDRPSDWLLFDGKPPSTLSGKH